jgi:starch phosphorylase
LNIETRGVKEQSEDREIASMIEKDPLCGIPVDPEQAQFKIEAWGSMYYFCSERCMHLFQERPLIAYFSMEVGITSEVPTYSGGLGILAGDTIRSSADLRIPLVAVTLVSRGGYLKQQITENGEQIEHPDKWNPSKFMRQIPIQTKVTIKGREVTVIAWLYEHRSFTGGVVPVLFLDTDVEGNAPDDRRITDLLYGGDTKYRLTQEIILGIAGIRILNALKLHIRNYHMNEGHSSLLTLELLKQNDMDANRVRDQCIFTTHTPVDCALNKFTNNTVTDIMKDEFPIEDLKKYGGQGYLNMSLLALNLSKYVNGVTKAHVNSSKNLFPGYTIKAVTNGVHSYTWTCSHFRELYDKYVPGWANEPELLVRVDGIPNGEIWNAHMKAKKSLINYINTKTKVEMDNSTLTIGWARRATGYKRGNLIFSDLTRLRKVTKRGNIQLVFAGKAHPRDISGKKIIKEIHKNKEQLKNEINIVYLDNYDMAMGAKLTSSVDVWLNTPLPPFEASGTSGMKAAHNGVLNFSVLDGWWIEGCIEGVTGWAIGPSPNELVSQEERETRELDDLYNKLAYLIIPTFYNNRDEWVEMMENTISKVAYYFNSHRMMRRYATEAYLL